MATIQEALTIALDHHQAGRPMEAEILCRRILDADPDQAAAWHLLGILHAQAGRFAEAAALLGEAVARAPGPDVHRHRAMARQEAGDLEGAVADYREAARLNPALADASLNAGILLERLGRSGDALAAYRNALDAGGNHAGGNHALAAKNLGRLLLAGGNAAEASAILERAVRADPTLLESWYHLADAHARSGNAAGAEAARRRALALAPAFFGILARAPVSGDNPDDAARRLGWAMALEPHRPEPLCNLAATRFRQGRLAEADALYTTHLERASTDSAGWSARAVCRMEAGGTERADADGRRALALDPAAAEALATLSVLLSRRGAPFTAGTLHRRMRRLTDGPAAGGDDDLDALVRATADAMPFLAEASSPDRRNAAARAFNPHLRVRHHDTETRDRITAFWSGAPLNAGARLALRSMVAQGHPVHLFSYGDPALLGRVPDGVRVEDAGTVVPRHVYDLCVRSAEVRYFSDIFRYAALHAFGGWWLDTDVVLLKPLSFGPGHLFCSQWHGLDAGHALVGDAIRAPRGSVHMRRLFEESMRILTSGSDRRFGAVGPLLLSRYLLTGPGRELLDRVLPPTVFNAVDWTEHSWLAETGGRALALLSDERVAGVHLWNGMWGPGGPPVDDADAESVLGRLAALHDPEGGLSALAVRFHSDKGPRLGAEHLGHHYTRVYDALFAPRRFEALRILEIGLCRGRVEGWRQDDVPSLRMWERYFPNASVIGADIEDFSDFNGGRVETRRVDQGDPDALRRLAEEDGPFDIVIDDGSHASRHQQVTLAALFGRLRPGGLYIIEDLNWQPPDVERPEDRLTLDVLRGFMDDGRIDSPHIGAEDRRTLESAMGRVELYDSVSELVGSEHMAGLAVIHRRDADS